MIVHVHGIVLLVHNNSTYCNKPASVSWQSMNVVRFAFTKAIGPSCR